MLKKYRRSLKYIAESGSLAEEVISTIRTAQAFGTQKILSGLYDEHVEGSRRVGSRAAVFHSGALAVMFFVIYASYALGKMNHFYRLRS
jgi:ATP-binding cassette subfamily B (MDR/TAP) protein 1